MADFSIKTIPHAKQRYNTVGDYQTDGSTTSIAVSDMGNEKYEFLVALHELVESFLCRRAGVTDAAIDEFDFAFTAKRAADDGSEPGDDPTAPYHVQHEVAKRVERIVAEALLVDWDAYDTKAAELMRTRAEGE